jgi:hypothetical protein
MVCDVPAMYGSKVTTCRMDHEMAVMLQGTLREMLPPVLQNK